MMKKNLIISKPTESEYPKGFGLYMELVPSNDLLDYFAHPSESIAALAPALTEAQLLYRYASGKWSVKDIFAHVIDCERIYCYRALCIARGETQALPGFEENDYARQAKADERGASSHIDTCRQKVISPETH